jgi:glycerate kinase
LAALGGTLRGGFEVVAERVDLDEAIEAADAVLTGEGLMDAASFEGKVVGGVAELAGQLGIPVGAVVGDVDPGLRDVPVGLEVASLVADAGREAAFADAASAVAAAAEALLTRMLGSPDG